MWVALGIVGGIIVLIVASVRVGFSIMKHEYDARPEVLLSTGEPHKKALVVYQPSVTEASSDVAHAIAQGINGAGYEVTLNTPGRHLTDDISDYSIIVFGSPNYGGSPGEPLLNYMKRIEDFSGKRICLFSTSGSAEGRLEFEKMEALLQGIKPYNTIKLAASDAEANIVTAYQFGQDAAGQ